MQRRGTYSNRDVLVNTVLKGVGVTVEKLLAESLGDRFGEIAFSCLLAGMTVTNGPHPLDAKISDKPKVMISEMAG